MLKSVIRVTFLEGIRSKAVYGILLLAAIMMLLSIFLGSMVMRDVGKVVTDLALSTTTFAALLVVLFIGINILNRDMERKTIYLALSRSVSRPAYLIARFMGLGFLLGAIILILLLASLATILITRQMLPNYFGNVSLAMVAVAHLFILLQMLILTALSILFSMFASSSFVTLLLTILTWIIGSSTQNVKQLLASSEVSKIAASTKMIVQAAYYIFPNFAAFDIKTLAAHGLPVDFIQLGYTALYSFGYLIFILSLAIILFKRKEFI